MKKLLATLSLMLSVSAFSQTQTYCGTLYIEGNSFSGQRIELEVRSSRVYELIGLSQAAISTVSDGARYCVTGTEQLSFSGKKQINVLLIDEE